MRPLLMLPLCWLSIGHALCEEPKAAGVIGYDLNQENFLKYEESIVAKTEPAGDVYSENRILRLPKSVHYAARADGKHIYTIEGTAGDRPAESKPTVDPTVFGHTAMDYGIAMPFLKTNISMDIDYDKRQAVFETPRKLELQEISTVINTFAHLRSDIPCWAELMMRDVERSPDFRPDRYVVEEVEDEFPAGLAVHWALPYKGLSMPFVIRFGNSRGSLFVVPTAVPRTTELRHAIHILDGTGRIIWSDTTTATGMVFFAPIAPDMYSNHEIHLECHPGKKGVTSRFHITQKK